MNKIYTPTRLIGPEDVTPGDYVTIAETTGQVLPNRCVEAHEREIELLKFTMWPDEAGQPLKVQAVSLPFVLVQTVGGPSAIIDLRQHRLARLPEAFGRLAFARLGGEQDRCGKKQKKAKKAKQAD